jgi:hypothetical protein
MSGIRGLLVRAFVALALLAGVSGCGSEPSPTGDAQISSELGAFVATLSANPDPPAVGDNTLALELADARGANVVGATLAVYAWMPTHGHTITSTPVVSDLGEGTYRIEGVSFTMPGRWELSIDVSASGAEDRLNLALDVRYVR